MVQTIPWADQQDHGTWPRCEALFRKLLAVCGVDNGSVPGQRRPTPRARHAALSSAARSASLVLTPAQPSTVGPCERWNFSTAARVAGPYLPPTSSSAPSITLSAACTHF